MTDTTALRKELEVITGDEKKLAAVMNDPVSRKDFLQKMKLIIDEIDDITGNEQKMTAVIADPEKRNDLIAKMKLVHPEQAAAADKLGVTLEAMAKGDTSDPMVLKAKKLGSDWSADYKQVEASKKDLEQKEAEVQRRFGKAKFLHRALMGISAVVGAAAIYAMGNTKGAWRVASSVVTAAAGGSLGWLATSKSWRKPFAAELEGYQKERVEKDRMLEGKTQMLEQVLEREAAQLTDKMMQPSQKSTENTSSIQPNFVEKLQTEEKSATVGR